MFYVILMNLLLSFIKCAETFQSTFKNFSQKPTVFSSKCVLISGGHFVGRKLNRVIWRHIHSAERSHIPKNNGKRKIIIFKSVGWDGICDRSQEVQKKNTQILLIHSENRQSLTNLRLVVKTSQFCRRFKKKNPTFQCYLSRPYLPPQPPVRLLRQATPG